MFTSTLNPLFPQEVAQVWITVSQVSTTTIVFPQAQVLLRVVPEQSTWHSFTFTSMPAAAQVAAHCSTFALHCPS